jgi:capsule polysaccharide export protein KpsE/RkpR
MRKFYVALIISGLLASTGAMAETRADVEKKIAEKKDHMKFTADRINKLTKNENVFKADLGKLTVKLAEMKKKSAPLTEVDMKEIARLEREIDVKQLQIDTTKHEMDASLIQTDKIKILIDDLEAKKRALPK